MRQIRVSGFVRSDLPAEISMSHVGSNPMFQTFCQQSSATVTAKKGGKLTDGSAAWQMQQNRKAVIDVTCGEASSRQSNKWLERRQAVMCLFAATDLKV